MILPVNVAVQRALNALSMAFGGEAQYGEPEMALAIFGQNRGVGPLHGIRVSEVIPEMARQWGTRFPELNEALAAEDIKAQLSRIALDSSQGFVYCEGTPLWSADSGDMPWEPPAPPEGSYSASDEEVARRPCAIPVLDLTAELGPFYSANDLDPLEHDRTDRGDALRALFVQRVMAHLNLAEVSVCYSGGGDDGSFDLESLRLAEEHPAYFKFVFPEGEYGAAAIVRYPEESDEDFLLRQGKANDWSLPARQKGAPAWLLDIQDAEVTLPIRRSKWSEEGWSTEISLESRNILEVLREIASAHVSDRHGAWCDQHSADGRVRFTPVALENDHTDYEEVGTTYRDVVPHTRPDPAGDLPAQEEAPSPEEAPPVEGE